MGRTLDKQLQFGVALVAVAFIFTAVLSYLNIQSLKKDAGWVSHTHEILALTNSVLLAVVDAETGERGFVITGREEFLDPYYRAIARVDKHMLNLKNKSEKDGWNSDRLKKLAEMIDNRLMLLKEAIRLRRKGAAEAQEFILAKWGKDQMDDIRGLVHEIRQEELAKLDNRAKQSARGYRIAVLTGLFTGLMGLAVVSAFVYMLHRSLLARQKSAGIIQEEREWFRTTLASIGDAVIATDIRAHVTYLNPSAEQLTGWTNDEARGKPLDTVFKIIHRKSRLPADNLIVQALDQNSIMTLSQNTILISKNGLEMPVDESAATIRNESGAVHGAVLVFRDVSQRQRTEAEIRERMSLLALNSDIGAALTQNGTLEEILYECVQAMAKHIEHVQVCVWTVAGSGKELELRACSGGPIEVGAELKSIAFGQFAVGKIASNRRSVLIDRLSDAAELPLIEKLLQAGMLAFAGYPLVVDDELVGVFALFIERELSGHTIDAMSAVADEIAVGIQRKQTEEDLENRVHSRTADLADANNALQLEVSERREAEEKVRLFADELQRSNRELEQFASVASHDLQEPLRKIQAFGDRLQAKFGETLAEQGKEYLDRMRAAASRMRTLIDDLLSYSRVTTKAQPFEEVDLEDEAYKVVSDLEGRIEDVGGKVEIGPLPRIVADPTQMRQLLQNLIGNGLKFHRPEVSPLIRVHGSILNGNADNADHDPDLTPSESAEDPEEGDDAPRNNFASEAYCEIIIEDNGIGFDEKYLDRIFQLFQRLHSRAEYEGTGIGLAICRKIVERHGGAISASSVPGQGATFKIILPLRTPNERTP